VRELRTAIEHAVVLSRGDKITPRDLPPWVRNSPLTSATPRQILARNDLTMQEAEKELILRALKETGGNRTEAARKLGMSRRTLHRKLREYKLHGEI
jgi:DNA-binding NtrC family response regulator